MEIFNSSIDIEIPRASKEAISVIEKNGGSIRCVYFGKRSIIKLRKMEIYDPEVVKTFSMPPPKLWRYYMRSDIRGYLADNNPINPYRDLVPPEDEEKEREKGKIRLMKYKKREI